MWSPLAAPEVVPYARPLKIGCHVSGGHSQCAGIVTQMAQQVAALLLTNDNRAMVDRYARNGSCSVPMWPGPKGCSPVPRATRDIFNYDEGQGSRWHWG